MQYFRQRFTEASFYIALDLVVAGVTYIASYNEPGLHTGQLLMRILGAMLLANGLVGGPDTMMYWKESGRRIKAEEERDEARKLLADARKERDAELAAARERAAKRAEQDAADEKAARERAVAAAESAANAAALAAESMAAATERDAEHLREMRELRAEVAELRAAQQTRRPRRPLRTPAGTA